MTDEIRALIKLVALVGLIIVFIVDFLISPLFKPKGFVRRVVTSTIGIALIFVVLLL
jgi:ABC-type Fe3+-siderophore transport system permease subunit